VRADGQIERRRSQLNVDDLQTTGLVPSGKLPLAQCGRFPQPAHGVADLAVQVELPSLTLVQP
jgi:hypothetical protein